LDWFAFVFDGRSWRPKFCRWFEDAILRLFKLYWQQAQGCEIEVGWEKKVEAGKMVGAKA